MPSRAARGRVPVPPGPVGGRAVERLEPRVLLAASDTVLGLHRVDAELSQVRDGSTFGTVGDRALIIGGLQGRFDPTAVDPTALITVDRAPSDVVDVYDATTGQWAVTHLPHARTGATAVTLGGDVFVSGGTTGNDVSPTPVGPVDVYHARAGTWSTLAVPAPGGFDAAGVVGDTVIFTAAGTFAQPAGGPQVELYNVATGRWAGHSLSSGGHGALAVVGSRAMFFQSGGVIDIYDAATGRWSTRRIRAADFGGAYERPSTSGQAPAQMAVVGGKVVFPIVYSGSTAHGQITGGVYDPATGRWSQPAVPLWGDLTATVIGSTAIFMPGPSRYDASDEAILYNARTGRWSTHTLSEYKAGPEGFVVGHEALFIGGGTPADRSSVPSYTFDVYDQRTGRWSHGTIARSLGDSSDGVPQVVDGQLVALTTDGLGRHAVALFVAGSVAEPADPGVKDGGAVAVPPRALTWAAADGATGYEVYLDDRLAARVSTNRWDVGHSLAAGDHTWQVVAVDGDERTPGPRWRFAVGAPAAPGGPSVPDGAPLDAPPNTLSWAATPGARDYQLYVDGQRALRTASTVATIDEPLAGGPHTWAVVARNAIGATSGPTWTFATPAPPFAQSSQPFSGTLVYCDPVAVDGKVVFTTTPSLSPNEVWNGVPVLNVFDPVTGSLAASDFPGGLDTYGLGSTFLANPALRPPAVVGARVLFYDSTVVDVYDLSTRQWSTHPLSVARTAMAIAVVGDQVVFAGGDGKRGGGGAVDIYHADTDQWSTARLSAPRDGIAVAIVGGKLVLAGGYDDAELKPSDAFDVYDPASGQWTAGRLAVPHDVSAVAVVGNSALFAGGFSAPRKGGRTRPTDAVEVYDAGSGQWSIAHLSSPGSDITALAVGHFALFAGQPRADWTQPAAVDLYDAQRGTWSAAQLSPPSLAFAGETGAATVGDRALFTHDGVADVFDASTGQWSSRPLPGFVDESASNEPPDIGQVRVVGHVALIGGGQALHVYDADADRWSVVRLEGEGINLYTGVVVGTRAVYLTRAGKYGNPVIGTPRLDVLTLLPEQGNQP